MEIVFRPIGIVHSLYDTPEDVKRDRRKSSCEREEKKGKLEIFSEYEEGLTDIDGFSHLYVLFAFHQSGPGSLWAHPPHDRKKRGVFSTRSPRRPNPLGMTIVKLIERKGNILKVAGIDMVDGTPILDIKPYLPGDRKEDARFGWLEACIDNA